MGDAAMAHDPLSGNGLAAALASGIEGAQAIATWLGGSGVALRHYADHRNRAWDVYFRGLSRLYREGWA